MARLTGSWPLSALAQKDKSAELWRLVVVFNDWT